MLSRQHLVIDDHLDKIVRLIKEHPSLILKASPGSGKTTRVPPALLNHFEGKILVLEPRRVAAKMSASRVAQEQGDVVGGEVGYQFRFEKKSSDETKLLFITEGLLLRLLKVDPELRTVSVVIIDEFHERNMQTDLALALISNLQLRRPDLKLVVMSATLDSTRLKEYLPNSAEYIVEVESHPLEIRYLDRTTHLPLHEVICATVQRAWQQSGDILVFLPGQREIRYCLERLSLQLPDALILPLYGELPISEQVKALEKASARKIILSTNIAETSLTIDGISIVIDSGLCRQSRWSQWSGIPILETKMISKASAIQRAARACRQGPGICFRTYTEADYKGRLDYEKPQIYRIDLSAVALELAGLGWSPYESFPWYEAPGADDWKRALNALENLDALEGGKLSALGKAMAELALPPRLSRVVVEAAACGASRSVLKVIAGIEEGQDQIFDIRDWMTVPLRGRAEKLYENLKLKTHLREKDEFAVLEQQCFLSGFWDRVQSLDKGFALVIEARELKNKGHSIQKPVYVMPIDAELLEKHKKTEVFEEVVWNPSAKKIEKFSGLRLGEIQLWKDREKLSEQDFESASKILIEEGLKLNLSALSGVDELLKLLTHSISVENLHSALARLDFLSGQKDFENLNKVFLNLEWFPRCLLGCLDISSVSKIDWTSAILSAVQIEIRDIDRLVPTHIQINQKKRVPVHYDLNKAPWIESRIQDFFGQKEGPKIPAGQVPVTLHLLAPNMRSVQVTSDLRNFWIQHYPTVRQELKRRYPKHKWPEDPLRPESAKV